MTKLFTCLFVLGAFSFGPSKLLFAQTTLTGETSVCTGVEYQYYFDDQNPYCNNILWEVYENGVLRTDYVKSSDNASIWVVWKSNPGSGNVMARG
jgi:hypothetical protein